VHLADDAGGQIKATMFKEAVELFQERFQENCYCVISGGVLKPADKKFSKLPNDFEMTLNASAQVRPVSLSRRDKSSASSSGTASKRRRLDDGGGSKTDQRQMQFGSFTPLRKLALIEAKTFVSVLGVIVHWSPLATLVNKTTGRETLKRQFSMLDKSKTLVSVNVWDKETTRLDETTLPLQSIVAIKNACVSDYGGGRSLDCSPVVAVNPEVSSVAFIRSFDDSIVSYPPIYRACVLTAVSRANSPSAYMVLEAWRRQAASRRRRARYARCRRG
jgi:replication factor A1